MAWNLHKGRNLSINQYLYKTYHLNSDFVSQIAVSDREYKNQGFSGCFDHFFWSKKIESIQGIP
jgi:hypothetical protein